MRSLRSSGSVGGVVRPSAGLPYSGSNRGGGGAFPTCRQPQRKAPPEAGAPRQGERAVCDDVKYENLSDTRSGVGMKVLFCGLEVFAGHPSGRVSESDGQPFGGAIHPGTASDDDLRSIGD